MPCEHTAKNIEVFTAHDVETAEYREMLSHLDSCADCHVEITQVLDTLSTLEGSLSPLKLTEKLPLNWERLKDQTDAPAHHAIRLSFILEGKHGVHELRDRLITLGRTPDNTLPIPDAAVSRLHCRIEHTPEGFQISDPGSVNGTYLNKQRLTAPAMLKRGDVITLGTIPVTVESIEQSPAAVIVPVHDITPKAPPRITSRLTQRLQPATAGAEPEIPEDDVVRAKRLMRKYWRIPAIAAAVLIAISVVPDVFYSRQLTTGPDPRLAHLLQTLSSELTALRAEVEQTQVVTQSHMSRCLDLMTRAEPIPYSQDRLNFEERCVDLQRSIYERQRESIAEEIRKVEIKTGAALKNGQYSRVLPVYHESARAVSDPLWENAFTEKIKDIEEQIVKPDADHILAQEKRFRDKENFSEARELIQQNQERFKETASYTTFQAALQGLERLERSIADLPESAGTGSSKPVPKNFMAALKPLEDQAVTLTQAGKLMEAEAAYLELVNKTSAYPDLAARYQKNYDGLHATNALFHKLITAINDGKLSPVKARTASGQSGTPTKADQTGITFMVDAAPRMSPWGKLSPSTIYELLSKTSTSDDDLYVLAAYCVDHKLTKEAIMTLQNYMPGNKEKASILIARMKGLARAPAGGFVYDPKTKDFVSLAAKKESDALAVMDQTVRGLSTATDSSSADKYFEQLLAMIDDPDLSREFRSEIKGKAIDGLNANKRKKLEQIKKNAASKVSFSQLKELKTKLNAAREEALRVIFDTKIYPDENHGRVGQPKVDEAVRKVRTIWDNSGKVIVESNPELKKDIELVVQVNDSYLKRLGVTSDAGDLADLQDIVNNIGGRIDLKNFALDGKERQFIENNKRIERTNQSMSGVPDDIREQVRVTNDYREMMGRGRLLIDTHLNQAAQFHTENMSRAGNIWHNGSDGTVTGRLKKYGFNGPGGENVAQGYPSPAAVHDGWYHSSGHHRNILSKFWSLIGVGHVNDFWTQDFGATRETMGK